MSGPLGGIFFDSHCRHYGTMLIDLQTSTAEIIKCTAVNLP